MAEIIIHVGYGKTGTSAIQRALSDSSGSLAGSGVCYRGRTLLREEPFDEGFESISDYRKQMAAANLAEGGDFPARAAAVLDEAANNFDLVIWSDEALAPEWKMVARIIELLEKRHAITVVLYLRNHTDWILSAYLQWGIKHKANPGRILPFEEFLESREDLLDYEGVIDSWQNAIGGARLVTRSYDDVEDVVADFLSISGRMAGIRPSSTANETPGYSVLSLFKILNDQIDEDVMPDGLMRALRRAGLLNRDIHPVDPVPLDLEQEDLVELSKRFAPQRERLKAKYSIVLNDEPKPNRYGNREWSSKDNTDLIAILGHLVVDLSERISRLEKKLAHAKKAGTGDS